MSESDEIYVQLLSTASSKIVKTNILVNLNPIELNNK